MIWFVSLSTWWAACFHYLTCAVLLRCDLASGKKRKPAWCDRILWRVQSKSLQKGAVKDGDDKEEQKKKQEDEFPLRVTQQCYTNKMEYSVSDHKPVVGIFCLEVSYVYSIK